MTPKAIKAAAAAAIVAVAAYWYWSPFLAVRQLQSAAQNRDAGAFNGHVDYPKLRDSLRGQFSAMFTDKLAKPADSRSDLAKAGAAFGTRLGLVMVNQFIDAVARPEVIMQAVEDGRLVRKPKQSAGTRQQAAGNLAGPLGVESKVGKPTWTYERQGVDQLIAYATDPKKPDDGNPAKFALVLQRSGFANWKLTEVRLPGLHQ
jgi:hypothetical protein